MRRAGYVVLAMIVSAGLLFASEQQAADQMLAFAPSDICGKLAQVKRIPFKDERVEDKTYNEIVQLGESVVPSLIECLTDLTKMREPRSAPSYDDFRVGDLAFFLLLDITKVPFEQMLPKSVRAQLPSQGVYAYFEYVENPANRKALQKRWKSWHKKRAVGGTRPSDK